MSAQLILYYHNRRQTGGKPRQIGFIQLLLSGMCLLLLLLLCNRMLLESRIYDWVHRYWKKEGSDCMFLWLMSWRPLSSFEPHRDFLDKFFPISETVFQLERAVRRLLLSLVTAWRPYRRSLLDAYYLNDIFTKGGQFGYLSSKPPPRCLNRRQIAAYVCLPPFSSIGVFFYTVFDCYFLKPLCQCISDEACERRQTFHCGTMMSAGLAINIRSLCS